MQPASYRPGGETTDGETNTVVVAPGTPSASARAAIVRAMATGSGAPVVVVADWVGARPDGGLPGDGLRLVDALTAGARACVAAGSSSAVLAEARGAARTGGVFLGPGLGAILQDELRPGRTAASCLAPREIETLALIASGLTQHQAARRMGCSPATVNTYTKRLRVKLNVGNKADLTRAAFELGLLGPTRQVPA